MVDEKPDKYEQQESLPIPTYEQAITSRPSSSQGFLGPAEVSNDAERQGRLDQARGQPDGYQVTNFHSDGSDLVSLLSSRANSPGISTQSLRREMLQMDIIEPGLEGDSERLWVRTNRFSNRITSLKHSLSTIRVPFRQWLPSRDYITSRMPSMPQRIQPNWILVGRFFAVFLVVCLVYLLFVSDLFTIGRRRGMGQVYDPESVRMFVQDHVNETYIQRNSEHLTMFDHVAGTVGSFVLARWMEDLFQQAELESVGLERFDVFLNFPRADGRRVAIVEPPEMAWEALIEEEPVHASSPRNQTLVFHGLSRSGNVTGPLVYANYGSRADFQTLKDNGINVTGSVALVRYYGTQGDRAMKVKAAEGAGAVGCIIYSDPAEDGFRKGKVFPDGRYMPSDGVQRGSVSLTSWVVGDVLSSGFASLPGESKRDSKDNNPGLNNIPSIPLAWRDAQKLLQAIRGHGKELARLSSRNIEDRWEIGGVPDVEWWTGDQSSPIIHLKNEQDEDERHPIYNVVGKIIGLEQPEKTIVVGNHYDAWCKGATDPGSGTAVFLEVVRIFGELKQLGWRPLRTIEFAAWDGEEYNLVGSTEHVESRIEELRHNGFAYLNVDVAVVGNDFEAAASPLFEKALLRVLDRVSDPLGNKTLRAIWDENNTTLGGLAAGSDYVAFQDMAGTSSLDMSFGGPPYPYHSCYDNFDWMRLYGDTGFQYHKTLAQIWALLILEMADSPILPFDLEAYARAVQSYLEDLEDYARIKGAPQGTFDLKPLHRAADEFSRNAEKFHEWDRAWSDALSGRGGLESSVTAIKRMSHNTRMANFETNLLDVDGGVSI